ncbi:MAG: LysM peptidoglycan-binding domain-containing protein [Candidatus Woesearchaeota archaeon]
MGNSNQTFQFEPIQVQKILHLLIINSYDLNNETLFSQEIKDDNTVLNNNIKDKTEILDYLKSLGVIEKKDNSFYITHQFIEGVKELKMQVMNNKIFEKVNSSGVSNVPFDFSQQSIAPFQELIINYLDCVCEIDSNYYLYTKFKHTKSILSFYYLLNPDFAKQICIAYVDNIKFIKDNSREQIEFIEIFGGNRLNGNNSNDFRKKIPHFLTFLAQHIMKAKGYTYIPELQVFKKNHLLDTERDKIKQLVEKLLLDIQSDINSNPNINLYNYVSSTLNDFIQRRGNKFIINYGNLDLEFEHMDSQTIIEAVVVDIEGKLTGDDIEFEDITDKITPEIDEYLGQLKYTLVQQNSQQDAVPILSSSVLKQLKELGFTFQKQNSEEQIEEIIQILADRYGIDVEEIDYISKNENVKSRALKIVSTNTYSSEMFENVNVNYTHDYENNNITVDESKHSPNSSENEENEPEEIKKERKSFTTSKVIAGAFTLGVIGALLWDSQDEIVNYIQNFFNSPTSDTVENVIVQPPPVQPIVDVHDVVQGDNLWNIAHSYLGSTATDAQILELTNELAHFNNLSNPDLIHPGDEIKVPQELVEKFKKI